MLDDSQVTLDDGQGSEEVAIFGARKEEESV